MRTTVLETYPKLCFTIPLIRENRFNPFDYICNNAFQTFVITEKDDFSKFLTKHQLRVACSARNLAKSFFSNVTKVRNVTNGTECNGLNPFSRIRGIEEQGLRYFFITSNSSYFFNKADLEQCRF